MKLEVGMYVRTNDGYINKIKKVNQYNVLVDARDLFGEELNIPNNEIIKASHTLLGNDKEPCLIEIGDYVNGMKVTRISGTRYDDNDLHCYCEHNGDENWKRVMIPAKDIRTIVTKEQMEAMQYKVVE